MQTPEPNPWAETFQCECCWEHVTSEPHYYGEFTFCDKCHAEQERISEEISIAAYLE